MNNEPRERFSPEVWHLRGDPIEPRTCLGTAVRALVQAVLLLVQFTAGAADDPYTGATALMGATVIDGTGNTPRGEAVVLVSGGAYQRGGASR